MLQMDGWQPPELVDVILGGLRMWMALKGLLCSNNDALPQHWCVLRAIHTLNSPKNYICLLEGLSSIHSTHQCEEQGLMWGTRGAYLLAAAMVGYGCVGQCWPLEANVRSSYCRNCKIVYRSILFLFLCRSHTFLTSDPSAKTGKLICSLAASYALAFTVEYTWIGFVTRKKIHHQFWGSYWFLRSDTVWIKIYLCTDKIYVCTLYESKYLRMYFMPILLCRNCTSSYESDEIVRFSALRL